MALRSKILDPKIAASRLEALCARSEQCTFDLSRKLAGWGVPSSEAQSILQSLEAQGFVDDARYAVAFVRDKYRFSRWGVYKIRMHLSARRISTADIESALRAIDRDEYYRLLLSALRARARTLSPEELGTPEGRLRLMRFAISRGYESALVSRAIREL